MLRAAYRILRPGGTAAFAVIALAEGVERSALHEDAGPPHPETDEGYPLLMERAGFVDVDCIDVSAEYLETTTGWLNGWESEAYELRKLVGIDAFDLQQGRRRQHVSAIERGQLLRYLVSGRRR